MTNAKKPSLNVVESYTDSPIPLTKLSHSLNLIPSAESQGKPLKRYKSFMMNLVVVIGVPLLMVVLGLGLEITIFLSNKTDGFKVSQRNVLNSLADVTTQFLASFSPTLVVIPIAIAWRELDWILRRYQPYMVLYKGNAKAEESLFLDYIGLGRVNQALVLLHSFNYKHRVIFWSSLTAILTYVYQPLAGSIFQIQQRPKATDLNVTSTKSIGLSTQIFDLNAFIAAAGYVDSSVLFGFSDPPFVHNGWATATFEFPKIQYLNGSMTINTTGIQTNVTCSNPSEPPILTPVDTTNFSLSSTSVDGCVLSVTFDSTAPEPYGVSDVACPGNASTLDSSLRPVMFWFFHIRDDNNTAEAQTVFCTPTIQAREIKVVANLNNGSLTAVSAIGNFLPQNNVTGAGGVLNGSAFNGLIFDNITDPFIEGRAIATRSVVPGAIFRSAQQLPNGPQSTFDLANGFLDLTNTLYTRHLSISAQSIYFLSTNTTLPATVFSLLPSLKVVPLPAHFLAITLILTGLIGAFLQVISWRRRQHLLLTAPIGNLASTIALTSQSGFGELSDPMVPYDDELTLKRKLDSLRFRLDERTGAIVIDQVETEDDAASSLLNRTEGVGIPREVSSVPQ